MRPGRLFWKFFFAFWLALLLAGVGVGSAVWWHQQGVRERLDAERDSTLAGGPRAALAVSGAAAVLGHGGLPALRQFLAEAIVLTSVAGIIGMLFGFSLSWLAIQIILKFQSGWTFVVPWNGAILGFGVSAAIGIIFGYFPARTASKLNPIEALRYE